MKILCLADLHISKPDGYFFGEHTVNNLIENQEPDAVVIAGDIFDYPVSDPYEELVKRIPTDNPIICCLGNHEFAYKTVAEVIDRYATLYHPERYNVHYLDVCCHREVGDVNFVGNVLWYDGSLYPAGDMPDRVSAHWLDSSIIDFNWKAENAACVEQIKKGLLLGKTNILVTHCVPHGSLNMHPATSKMNGYSGMSNLFSKLGGHPKISWAICGHTHRRARGEFNGVFCVNIGNEYEFTGKEFQYYMMEV